MRSARLVFRADEAPDEIPSQEIPKELEETAGDYSEADATDSARLKAKTILLERFFRTSQTLLSANSPISTAFVEPMLWSA